MTEQRCSFAEVARIILGIIRRSTQTDKIYKGSGNAKINDAKNIPKIHAIKKDNYNENNIFFKPTHSPETMKTKCQTLSYFKKQENLVPAEKCGHRKFSLKVKIKQETGGEGVNNNSTALNEKQRRTSSLKLKSKYETETVKTKADEKHKRKFSLKSSLPRERKQPLDKQYLSCPDLRVEAGMVEDCLDKNTMDLFRDSMEHDDSDNELIELYAY